MSFSELATAEWVKDAVDEVIAPIMIACTTHASDMAAKSLPERTRFETRKLTLALAHKCTVELVVESQPYRAPVRYAHAVNFSCLMAGMVLECLKEALTSEEWDELSEKLKTVQEDAEVKLSNGLITEELIALTSRPDSKQ